MNEELIFLVVYLVKKCYNLFADQGIKKVKNWIHGYAASVKLFLNKVVYKYEVINY